MYQIKVLIHLIPFILLQKDQIKNVQRHLRIRNNLKNYVGAHLRILRHEPKKIRS